MKRDLKIIYQQLMDIEEELHKLLNVLHALKSTDLRTYGKKYEELSMNAALRSERIACRLRNLALGTEAPWKTDYLKLAAVAHGISISMADGVLSVTVPGLLPKRKLHTNSSFLHAPLNHALQEYAKTYRLPLFHDCVICFSQVYESEYPQERIRDHDNLEFKQLLDIIAAYVLVDDSGLLCDTHHMTERGDYRHTAIYVMERSAFPDWLKSRARPKIGRSEKS